MRYFREGNYFGFYVDLMGQKELYSSIPDRGPVADKSIRSKVLQTQYVVEMAFSHIRDFISRFRDNAQFVRELYASFGYEKYVKMPKEDFETHLRRLEYGTQQFSDSLIFYFRHEGPIASDVFTYCVQLFVLVLRQFLPNKVVYRGAISYGVGWESGQDALDGPLLHDLMRLEEKVAVYPRIVVGSSLYDLCHGVAMAYEPGKLLLISDFLGTLLRQFDVDADGVQHLSICSGDLVSSFREDELEQQKDLQIASQKFLHNEFKKFSSRASQAQTASEAGAYSKVALKYASAFAAGTKYCENLNCVEPDYDSLGENYEPMPENYEGTFAEIAEYTVLRLSFVGFADNEIDRSRAVNRAVRLLKRIVSWMRFLAPQFSARIRGNVDFSKQEVVMSQFANVAVVALKHEPSVSEYLMGIILALSVVIPRWVSKGVLVRGSLVSGNGWLVTGGTLCGPVMQKSYEYEVKVANPFFRVAIERTVSLAMKESALSAKVNLCDPQVVHPILADAISIDCDGIAILDYLKVYKMFCINVKKDFRRYSQDIAEAVRSLRFDPSLMFAEVKDRIALLAVAAYFKCMSEH